MNIYPVRVHSDPLDTFTEELSCGVHDLTEVPPLGQGPGGTQHPLRWPGQLQQVLKH